MSTSFEPSQLASGYLRYVAQLQHGDPDLVWNPDTDPSCAAYEEVNKTIVSGPPAQAWELALEILRQTPDEELATEAAGSLEDLVTHQGKHLIEQIERQAHKDERFRRALGSIWVSIGDLPDEVIERLVHASGNRIKPLSRSTRMPRQIERVRKRAT